jgi:hypothetical protein
MTKRRMMLALNISMSLWAFHKGFMSFSLLFLVLAIINMRYLNGSLTILNPFRRNIKPKTLYRLYLHTDKGTTFSHGTDFIEINDAISYGNVYIRDGHAVSFDVENKTL